MLTGLFVTPTIVAITEALGRDNAEGPIAVVGDAKVATAFRESREVIPVGMSARAAKKLEGAIADTSSIETRSLAAVIGINVTADEAWSETLRAWSRVVRDGGAIVFIDKGKADEASRRALCAGLSELEQRHAGRSVITSGLVTHL